jgi:hypothetical protein
MSIVKSIKIKPIDAKSAKKICEMYHYSNKSVPNSQIHLGVFLNGKCEGVMQFGPAMNKPAMVKNLKIGFNEFLELNRMAFSDKLPKNSESRSISVAIKIIKKKYPFIRLIVSYADACQCGDGAIYRASGFRLHSYKKNTTLLVIDQNICDKLSPFMKLKPGIVADKTLGNKVISGTSDPFLKNFKGQNLTIVARRLGAKHLEGYQMKYLYCIDKTLENKYNWIAFDSIPDDVKMYKGIKRIEHESNASNFQLEESGAIPTDTLHSQELTC